MNGIQMVLLMLSILVNIVDKQLRQFHRNYCSNPSQRGLERYLHHKSRAGIQEEPLVGKARWRLRPVLQRDLAWCGFETDREDNEFGFRRQIYVDAPKEWIAAALAFRGWVKSNHQPYNDIVYMEKRIIDSRLEYIFMRRATPSESVRFFYGIEGTYQMMEKAAQKKHISVIYATYGSRI